RQIDRRRASGKVQDGSAYWHVADDVAPLRDLPRNYAVPACEIGMICLIQKDQYVDRDQCVVHNRGRLPLRIVITDRKKHHISIADCGLRIADLSTPNQQSEI